MFTVYDEKPSNEFMAAIGNFEKDILSLNEKNWNNSTCELQYQYKEFIIWIEVYCLDQVTECPSTLLSLYINYSKIINDVNICTWINLKKNDNIYHVYSLERTDELIAVGKGEKYLDKNDFFEQSADDFSIFNRVLR